jgi:hypothetical protein
MAQDIYIFDQVIDQAYQMQLHQAFVGEMSAPWYLLEDVAYPSSEVTVKQPGLVHPLWDQQQLSPLYDLVIPMVDTAMSKINLTVRSVIRARSFLQFPRDTNRINHPHIDYNHPHWVCLYYVNDSDGDTVIYNQSAVEGKPTEFTVAQTVSPRQGRCVIFPGDRYHSSSTPTQDYRCIINFDIIT